MAEAKLIKRRQKPSSSNEGRNQAHQTKAEAKLIKQAGASESMRKLMQELGLKMIFKSPRHTQWVREGFEKLFCPKYKVFGYMYSMIQAKIL